MKRFSSLVIVSLFVLGCSQSAQTQLETAHHHSPTNSMLHGNGHGNAIVLPEPFLGLEHEGSRSTIASSSDVESSPAPDWSDALPFDSIPDGTSGAQWETTSGATAEQILGLEASSSPSSSPSEPTSQLTTAQVYREAGELPGLSSWTVVPFAHFRRGLTHVVVAWPALNSSGQTVDATVVGICLRESTDGSVEQCGRRWVVNERVASRAALEDALGGADYELVSQQSGAPLNELGPQLSQFGSEFVSAISRGDRTGARRIALGFVQMLPAEQIAFDNQLAQLLWVAASYDGRLEHVSTTQNNTMATLTFNVRRGWLRVRTIQVTARPAAANPGQWVVVSYQ